MTTTDATRVSSAAIADRRRGWLEAAGFVVALTFLNMAYALAHGAGAHPVAFLVYAMLTAALSLLAVTGTGPDWRAIVRHPLSWVVGFGIIGMEAGYYMLLRYVTPAEGSILNRVNLPASVVLGWLLFSRRTSLVSLAGLAVVGAAIVAFALTIPASNFGMAVFLGLLCAAISVTRNFSAEFHPWNRRAKDVIEKMRVTGLVLMVTSLAGTLIVAALMALVHAGVLPPSPAIPELSAFLHAPTIGLGLFMGVLVLTAMQYFGFSSVVRIGTERFIAAGSLVPLTTLAAQALAAMLGLLPTASVTTEFLAIMLAVIAGVLVFIYGGRQRS